MRSVSRDIEVGIELLKTPDDWDQLARQLQTSVADAVTTVFVEIERGAQSTRHAVVDLIGEDSGDALSEPTRSVQVELASMWPRCGRTGRSIRWASAGPDSWAPPSSGYEARKAES